MNALCPHCGSRTEELTQQTRSADAIDVFFKCTNRQCGAAVTGLLTLAATRTDHTHCFASHLPADDPRRASTDC